jgi:hypothetical protein
MLKISKVVRNRARGASMTLRCHCYQTVYLSGVNYSAESDPRSSGVQHDKYGIRELSFNRSSPREYFRGPEPKVEMFF